MTLLQKWLLLLLRRLHQMASAADGLRLHLVVVVVVLLLLLLLLL
jgi:hypothetical protein